jgi:Xaa-Pro aminopeptidase
VVVFDYPDRRRRLADRMREAGVDLLFLPPSSDLEYLTGVERAIPTFGQSQYAHGWVAGAFFRPDREPVFVLPRMMALFDIAGELPGELVVVGERDDGPALFGAAARGMDEVKTLAVGDPRLPNWRRVGARSCTTAEGSPEASARSRTSPTCTSTRTMRQR